MRFLKWIGIVLGIVVVVGGLVLGVARLLVEGPIAMLAGGSLGDAEAPAPDDWSFANEHSTIAVEVRPDDPHSVTTIHFVAENELYIPASRAPDKDWPSMAVENGTARVRIGDAVYPVALKRVERGTGAWDAAFEVARERFPQLAERYPDGIPDDVWLFHAERR